MTSPSIKIEIAELLMEACGFYEYSSRFVTKDLLAYDAREEIIGVVENIQPHMNALGVLANVYVG